MNRKTAVTLAAAFAAALPLAMTLAPGAAFGEMRTTSTPPPAATPKIHRREGAQLSEAVARIDLWSMDADT